LNEETLVYELKKKTTQAKAFEVLINRYKERLYWHIRGIVLDHTDTDDVLQNTLFVVVPYCNQRSIDFSKTKIKKIRTQ